MNARKSFIALAVCFVMASGFSLVHALDPTQVEPANLVSLSLRNDAGPCGAKNYYRLDMNGKAAADSFEVPPGQMLYVTDVSWRTRPGFGSTQFTVGRALLLSMRSLDSDGLDLTYPYTSGPVVVTTENENSRIGKAEHLATGFLLGPGRVLCPNVISQSLNGFGTESVSHSEVRGVLLGKPIPSLK